MSYQVDFTSWKPIFFQREPRKALALSGCALACIVVMIVGLVGAFGHMRGLNAASGWPVAAIGLLLAGLVFRHYRKCAYESRCELSKVLYVQALFQNHKKYAYKFFAEYIEEAAPNSSLGDKNISQLIATYTY